MRNLFAYLVCVGVRINALVLSEILVQQNPYQQKRGGLGYGIYAKVQSMPNIPTQSRSINIRINQASPLCLLKSKEGEGYEIECNKKIIATVSMFKPIKWINRKLSSGRMVPEIIQQHTQKNLVSIIGTTRCPLFNSGNACSFCEMSGGTNNLERSRADIIEALEIITEYSKDYILTFTSPLMTSESFEKVCYSLMKIKSCFPDMPMALESQPAPKYIIDRLKTSGVSTWMVPLDCYSPQAQRIFIPGKKDLLDQFYWDALAYAVSVFGEGNAISNLIVGLEDEHYTKKAIEKIIAYGVVPDLLPIRPTPYLRYETEPDSFVRMQDFLREELHRSGLGSRMSRVIAGCAACGGCGGGISANMIRR